jgi:hypothetical protein
MRMAADVAIGLLLPANPPVDVRKDPVRFRRVQDRSRGMTLELAPGEPRILRLCQPVLAVALPLNAESTLGDSSVVESHGQRIGIETNGPGARSTRNATSERCR